MSSCTEKQGVAPNIDSNTLITKRSREDIISNSFFQLHNDFILWVFDNYQDSAEYYASDPVDFMKFASRKWFLFTDVEPDADIMDWLFHNNELILSEPYYTYNEGFTDESLFNSYWSNTELGYIYTVLDSVYDAIGNEQSEGKIQQLISNGKARIIAINPAHKNSLINALTQSSYSFTLAYELDDLYFDDGPELSLWCFFYGAEADIEALHLFESWDTEGGASGHLGAIAYISLYAFAQCWYS